MIGDECVFKCGVEQVTARMNIERKSNGWLCAREQSLELVHLVGRRIMTLLWCNKRLRADTGLDLSINGNGTLIVYISDSAQ